MAAEQFKKYLIEVMQTFYSFLKVILLSKFKVSFPRISGNEECVILGNGPSLSESLNDNFGFISSRKKFCVNYFVQSDYYQKVQPDYYVLVAPEFWLANPADWHKKNRRELIAALETKTTWEMFLFIPFAAKRSNLWKELCSKNRNIRIVYFNNTPIEGNQKLINFLLSKNLGIPRPYNVLVPSIYLGINIGFKKVYLFGADHSWHEEIKVGSNNKVTVNHQHFYDSEKQIMPMWKLDGKEYYIHDIFRKLFLAFKGYFVLKQYANSVDVEIYNASKKSYIDAFEKIQI